MITLMLTLKLLKISQIGQELTIFLVISVQGFINFLNKFQYQFLKWYVSNVSEIFCCTTVFYTEDKNKNIMF